ncbi:hypothetical protein PN36_26465 [Candidatus Thiomargarita nelsonii]|uniref:Uncharacterized protein n=1 Tax=Candidatus Thiomargarita nelsonii TaxID=1003181 RepID=A0A0A6PBR6_9GAMM|nr:hypothetical protein PN36_26465 [Candidatus Thiomargarita nelsonii]
MDTKNPEKISLENNYIGQKKSDYLMEEISISTETKLVRFDWAIKHLLRDKANFDVLEPINFGERIQSP